MARADAFQPFDATAHWDAATQRLVVTGIMDEAPDVKTFTFRPERPGWFRYLPGQFITLELPVPGEPLMRTYTLSSSPSRPHAISVTVKAQKDSLGTRWMFNNLKPGSHLRAYGPAGDFTHHRHIASRYLFISAGSGITPMMSMLRWMADCEPNADVMFLNCARRPDELIFRRELEFLASRMPGLSLGLLVEERPPLHGWAGASGRIDSARLTMLAPDFRGREVFCCGPDPFMSSVRTILEQNGFAMAHYHQESFGTAPKQEEPAAAVPSIQPDVSHTIRFLKSGIEAQCAPGKTILETARKARVRIPAACEAGLCGTCKITKRSGDVLMDHNGGILDDEIAEGFILACCSKPQSDLEIDA
ncbi:MAG: hybrid-cluster NAD(P)-dependent oxidoreductase [Aestuariivirga sp.]